MSSNSNPLFQYFPSTSDGRICSTCQAPFGPKTGNSTMRRHLQRTHPQQMAQYISQGGSIPGSTPAKVKPPGGGGKGRRSAPPVVGGGGGGGEDGFGGIANAASAASASSSSPLAPALPPLPQLPLLIAPTFGLPTSTTSSLSSAASSASSAPSLPILPASATTSPPSLSSLPSSATTSSSSPPSAFTPPGTSIGVPFSDCTLEQLRLAQQHFSNDRQWLRFHTPRNLTLALVGEVGELAELFQWREDDSQPGLPAWTAGEKEALGEELSDVLLYLVRLSDRCGVDLSAAVQRKVRVNGDKYPAKRVRGRSDKYTKYVKDEEGAGVEEGKEGEQVEGVGSVNGDAAVEGKKGRKKRRKTQSTEPTSTTAAAEDSDGKQDEHKQATEMDGHKEPEEAKA